MAARYDAAVLAVVAFLAAVPATALAAVGQGQQGAIEAYSPERVIEGLRSAPAPRLSMTRNVAVATFRVTVEQRQLMPPFQEALQREFALTGFQRQSQEWRSRCCGVDLVGAIESITEALRRREVRRLRGEIARELALIEANRTRPVGMR